MNVLGVILIGTGILVMFSGIKMKQNALKSMYNTSNHFRVQRTDDEASEKEFSKLVKKGVAVLYIVGIVCILTGILFQVFYPG